jgi:predicted dehydrogenase
MKKSLKVGIIGAGMMANIAHCPSLLEIENVEIVAVCDIDSKKLKETAVKFNIPNVYKEYIKMLKEVELDLIYVLTPFLCIVSQSAKTCLLKNHQGYPFQKRRK